MRQIRLLLIDDNPKVAESVRLSLPEYEVTYVSSASRAFRVLEFESNTIDLLVIDYSMPEMNGLQFLLEVRKTLPKIPAIFLTGYGSKQIVVDALRARADDFIDKPFDPSVFKDRVQRLLGESHSQEALEGGADFRLKRYLKEHVHRFVMLQDAAQIMNLHPAHLSRKFKRDNQINFSEYRSKVKITEARHYLRQTRLSIAKISEKLGYQTSESFMKAFKRVTGMTPTEYRRQVDPSA